MTSREYLSPHIITRGQVYLHSKNYFQKFKTSHTLRLAARATPVLVAFPQLSNQFYVSSDTKRWQSLSASGKIAGRRWREARSEALDVVGGGSIERERVQRLAGGQGRKPNTVSTPSTRYTHFKRTGFSRGALDISQNTLKGWVDVYCVSGELIKAITGRIRTRLVKM